MVDEVVDCMNEWWLIGKEGGLEKDLKSVGSKWRLKDEVLVYK